MKFFKKLVLLISIVFLFTGCMGNNNAQSNIKKIDKGPKSLSDLSKKLDDILKLASNIERVNLGIEVEEDINEKLKTVKEQKTSQQNQQQGGGNQGGNQSGGGGSSSGGGEGGGSQGGGGGQGQQPQGAGGAEQGKEMSKDEKLEALWKMMDKDLEESHPLWNSYEAEAMKKGAAIERGNKFEESINKLTKAVENRTIMDIYDFGSQAILDLKPFYELYTDEMRGEVAQIKHDTYQAYIKGSQEKKDEAVALLNNKDENMNRIKLKLEGKEDQLKTLEKTTLSLGDMRKAMDVNSKRLLILKKDVLIKNLKELEE